LTCRDYAPTPATGGWRAAEMLIAVRYSQRSRSGTHQERDYLCVTFAKFYACDYSVGMSQRDTARSLDLAQGTVRRYLKHAALA
jgi:hypothetical protein